MKKIFNKIKVLWYRSSASRYRTYLKKKGVKIGDNFSIRGNIKSIAIDTSRPSLIEIGDNVTINSNFTLMTHDFVSGIFLNKYSDFIPSSGRVYIGNNVRFGVNCIVLKNVSIGDNCFIAAGSIVTRDIPQNSIVAGVPAKVISSLEDFYNKRRSEHIIEAYEYALSIIERFNRLPCPADFWEEFPLFVDKRNVELYPEIPIKAQLGDHYAMWLEKHIAKYKSFNEFLEAVKKYKDTK